MLAEKEQPFLNQRFWPNARRRNGILVLQEFEGLHVNDAGRQSWNASAAESMQMAKTLQTYHDIKGKRSFDESKFVDRENKKGQPPPACAQQSPVSFHLSCQARWKLNYSQ
jgi:hypothetical protein